MQFPKLGVFTEGPFDPKKDPIGSLITYAGCLPGKIHKYLQFENIKNTLYYSGYCFCKDDPKKEVDARPQMFKIALDLCPRGEINRYVEENTCKLINVQLCLNTFFKTSPGVCVMMARQR